MGFFDRLFGEKSPPRPTASRVPSAASADEQALERYRYLLRTAPPEAIEQAHAEAFAKLTPEQRAQALQLLSNEVPPAERTAVEPEPRALARLATRAEVRQPGTLERVLGPRGPGAGMGMGGMLAGSLLSGLAGAFIGTAIAHQFLGAFSDPGAGAEEGMDDAQADASADEGDAGADDMGGGDDFGGGFEDV